MDVSPSILLHLLPYGRITLDSFDEGHAVMQWAQGGTTSLTSGYPEVSVKGLARGPRINIT